MLARLGLRPSANREEIPEAPWTGAVLPNGWYLVFCSARCDPPELGEAALGELSSGCELVASAVEEHVMFCSSAYWKDGRKRWSIVHDAQQGIYHLAAEGELPASYPALRDRYLAEQQAEGGQAAGVDLVFEVPLEAGVELTRFRHDADFPGEEQAPFVVLERDPAGVAPRGARP